MTEQVTKAQIENAISPEIEALIDFIDPSGEGQKAIGRQIMLGQLARFTSSLTINVATEAAKETIEQTVAKVFQAINRSFDAPLSDGQSD